MKLEPLPTPPTQLALRHAETESAIQRLKADHVAITITEVLEQILHN